MNKTELMNSVAATSGLSMKNASLAVNALFAVISTNMQQGNDVVIPGFGSFKVKDRPARTGHNPRTGAAMKIAARKVVVFKPGSALKIAGKASSKNTKSKK